MFYRIAKKRITEGARSIEPVSRCISADVLSLFIIITTFPE